MDLLAADPDPLPPICTILGGVFLLEPSPAAAGELLRMMRSPGALLGVSNPALFEPVDRLNRTCSCLGGEDGTGASSSKAWVTFENLIAGGGSSSESLSSMSMRCSMGASAEKPCTPFEMDSGECRRSCGRPGCATAAMILLNLCISRCFGCAIGAVVFDAKGGYCGVKERASAPVAESASP